MKIKTYRDLIAWQKAMQLAKSIYNSTSEMPEAERFGLTAQMRRAAVSVPSNIAEGHGRHRRADYVRFLRNARGSLMELQTQVILADELKLFSATSALQALRAETDRVLQGLIRSLEQ